MRPVSRGEGPRDIVALSMIRAVVTLLGMCAVAFPQQISSQAEPDLRDVKRVAEGEKLYGAACAGCHGKTGEGGRGPNLADGQLLRRADNSRLFDIVKNGLPGTDMPPFRAGEPKVWAVVAYLRSLSAPAIQMPPPGDSAAGRAVFFGKGGCAECHAVAGEGGTLGPDFTEAGATRSVKQLREGILNPNRRIADSFRPVRVVTASGQTIEGVARNFTNYSIQVLDRKGQLHLLDTRELKEMFIDTSRSPMPSDYGKRLTPGEIDNLVAFLSRQSVRPLRIELEPRRGR